MSVAPESEEAVVEAVSAILGQPASVYTDLEKGSTTVSAYVGKISTEQRRALKQAIGRIVDAGLDCGSGRISVRRVRRENWAESWKRHFRPIEVNARLSVVPSWSRRRPKPGQVMVVLDPGLSFGTGHHPTTAFCLRQLARLRNPGAAQSLLDMGAGSGILGIAALKLGYAPVEAFDFDPDAVRVARENARANRVRLNVARRDLTVLPKRPARRFDVVCANLMYDLLIAERARILSRVAREGTLVLAGILKTQFGAVRRAYEEAGMRVTDETASGEWHSAAFRREMREGKLRNVINSRQARWPQCAKKRTKSL